MSVEIHILKFESYKIITLQSSKYWIQIRIRHSHPHPHAVYSNKINRPRERASTWASGSEDVSWQLNQNLPGSIFRFTRLDGFYWHLRK